MSATNEARPTFPPFTRETAAQKVRMAEMPGTIAIRKESPWLIRLTANGETVLNFQ